MRPEALADSFVKVLGTFAVLEENGTYLNTSPAGEPQLGKRGLYRLMGGDSAESIDERALLWVLNLSDGRFDLLDIATRADMPFQQISHAAHALAENGLLREARPGETIGPAS